jgi:hypothetical protein
MHLAAAAAAAAAAGCWVAAAVVQVLQQMLDHSLSQVADAVAAVVAETELQPVLDSVAACNPAQHQTRSINLKCISRICCSVERVPESCSTS